jgi:hypothetical protein
LASAYRFASSFQSIVFELRGQPQAKLFQQQQSQPLLFQATYFVELTTVLALLSSPIQVLFSQLPPIANARSLIASR